MSTPSSPTWSQRFIDAFNTHEVAPMQALTSPGIKWEDVSGHIEFEGHAGVKDMIDVTLVAIPDCTFTHHRGMKTGNSYVVEWTMSGTIFGQAFACRGASVGETDDAGLIVHNRDYWDSRSFPEMPAGPANPSLEEVEAKQAALNA